MRDAHIAAITIGTDFATSEAGIRIAEKNDGVWASIAVHPSHVHRPHHDKDEEKEPPLEEIFDAARFAELAIHPKAVAIGETGLDYYRLPQDEDEKKIVIAKQRDNFERQIAFAKEHRLPLIMHVRDAAQDALAMLRGSGYGQGVMHCFTGTSEEAEGFMELGFHISFAGIVTFPPRRGESENPLARTVRAVPMDRLLIETDAPWLAPAPKRGERNEPLGVQAVARAVASIKGADIGEIERITKENAIRLFRLA